MKRRAGRATFAPLANWRACLAFLLLTVAAAWSPPAVAQKAFLSSAAIRIAGHGRDAPCRASSWRAVAPESPARRQAPSEWDALLLSCAIEAPIAFSIARLARWPCRGPLHVGLASAVATAVTHPQMWAAALWAYPHFGYWPTVIGIESLVILVEAGLIAWMASLAPGRSLLVSLAANSASALFGLVFFR